MSRELLKGVCADCETTTEMSGQTLRRGSTVREAGEFLCLGCTASRTRMVRVLAELPSTMHEIKSRRMARV